MQNGRHEFPVHKGRHEFPVHKGRRIRNGALITASVAALTLMLTYLGYNLIHQKTSAPAAGTRAPTAAGPILDGSYRVDYDLVTQTQNGAQTQPSWAFLSSSRWDFRSMCTPTGCVATGTQSDDNNHQVARAPAYPHVLHFVDGHWQAAPVQGQIQQPRCLGANGKVVAGAETEAFTWSLEPQPDGTLPGVATETVLTNECAGQGTVVQTTLVLTRTGDVPPDVAVVDPATVTAAPAAATPAPPLRVRHSTAPIAWTTTGQSKRPTATQHPATSPPPRPLIGGRFVLCAQPRDAWPQDPGSPTPTTTRPQVLHTFSTSPTVTGKTRPIFMRPNGAVEQAEQSPTPRHLVGQWSHSPTARSEAL